MKRSHVTKIVGALALVAFPAAAAEPIGAIAGSYTGRYTCGAEWHDFEVEIASGSEPGRLVATVSLPQVRNRARGAKAWLQKRRKRKPSPARYRLEGPYHASNDSFFLGNEEWIGEPSREHTAFGLRGKFDPELRAMIGDTRGLCSGKFELALRGEQDAAGRIEALREKERSASRPERSAEPMRVSTLDESFEYLDSALTSDDGGSPEILPVEEVQQWLLDSKAKCLSTGRVRWRGTEATVPDRHFGSKWYVIDCRGDCRGVRYAPRGAGGLLTHFGLSKAAPVLHIRRMGLGESHFQWSFSRPETSGSGPEIRIHAWSSTWGDQGPGCDF